MSKFNTDSSHWWLATKLGSLSTDWVRDKNGEKYYYYNGDICTYISAVVKGFALFLMLAFAASVMVLMPMGNTLGWAAACLMSWSLIQYLGDGGIGFLIFIGIIEWVACFAVCGWFASTMIQASLMNRQAELDDKLRKENFEAWQVKRQIEREKFNRRKTRFSWFTNIKNAIGDFFNMVCTTITESFIVTWLSSVHNKMCINISVKPKHIQE